MTIINIKIKPSLSFISFLKLGKNIPLILQIIWKS